MKNNDYHITRLNELKLAHNEFRLKGTYTDTNNTLFDYLMSLGDRYLNGLTIMQWTEFRRTAQSNWVDELHYQLKSFKLSELPEVRITLERIEQNRMTESDNKKLWSKAQQVAFNKWLGQLAINLDQFEGRILSTITK